MIKNIGTTDRAIRIIAAIVFVYLFYSRFGGGAAGIIFLILAFVLLGTAIIGWCGLYTLLGISTVKKQAPAGEAEKQDSKDNPAQSPEN